MSRSPVQRERVLLTAALLVCTFLAALDVLVVVTAMPTIVASLGGLELYTWVFSSYLLASVASLPIYGRLADVYGRRPIFVLGTGVFLLGSLLCGSAQSMEQLVAFRAVQGLGAGAIQPVTLTILGDVYSLEERSRVSGLFSLVWTLAGVLGPPVGGLLAEHASWRYIFLLNLPVGLAAILMLSLAFRETVERRGHQIDYLGSGLLAAGLVALMLGMGEVQRRASESFEPSAVVLLAVALSLGWVFVQHERRVEEPVVPLTLFQNRLIAVSSIGAFLTGAVLLALNSFIPPYIQGVLGQSAAMTSVPLLTMSVGWSVASPIAGRMIVRVGYRVCGVLGAMLILAGAVTLAARLMVESLLALSLELGVVGVGLGFCTLSFVLAVQNAVAWEQRGVATSSSQLFRNIGGAVGVSAVGAVFGVRLRSELSHLPGAETLGVNALLDSSQRGAVPLDVLTVAVEALESGLHSAFVAVAVIAALAAFVVFLLPGGPAEEHQWSGAGPD